MTPSLRDRIFPLMIGFSGSLADQVTGGVIQFFGFRRQRSEVQQHHRELP